MHFERLQGQCFFQKDVIIVGYFLFYVFNVFINEISSFNGYLCLTELDLCTDKIAKKYFYLLLNIHIIISFIKIHSISYPGF